MNDALATDGPTTLGGLARRERVTPPAMTRLVQALEAEGLVERLPSATDGRQVGVRITAAGERLLEQRGQARAASKFASTGTLPAELVAALKPTEFLGYESLDADGLHVRAIVRDGKPVERLGAGERALVILEATPFYAESGGQVGDRGWLLDPSGDRFEVEDTLKLSGAFHGHLGTLQSGALEASNVDITAQLVNMITAQRNFQANAQMISTSDQITQTIINIR